MIRTSGAFLANVDFDVKYIFLVSSDASWLNIVAANGIRKWIESDNILEAWRAVATTVDDLNARILQGEHAPSQCNCDETEKQPLTCPALALPWINAIS